MKLTRKKRLHSVAFNITPMIDIVFLLIIFFMTVSQITHAVDHPVELPNVPATGSKSDASFVTINVDRSGKIFVAGKEYSVIRTIAILQQRIELHGKNADQIQLELRCDRRCPTKHINRIITELSNIGIQFVKIAVS